MLRGVVTGGFLIVAAAVLWGSFLVGVNTPVGTLLVNLGTEIIGIVITVAVVEWFFERRRVQSRARQLAWDTYHAIQHAVWIWQGGPREMDADDLRGLLGSVTDDDPVPDFTEGLLLSLGTRSRRLLDNDPVALDSIPGLMNGVEHTARLASLRDGKASRTPQAIASILDDATACIARALGRPTERHLPSLIWHRDPSVEMQERRHHGLSYKAQGGGAF